LPGFTGEPLGLDWSHVILDSKYPYLKPSWRGPALLRCGYYEEVRVSPVDSHRVQSNFHDQRISDSPLRGVHAPEDHHFREANPEANRQAKQRGIDHGVPGLACTRR
jgi:hypothetical protein